MPPFSSVSAAETVFPPIQRSQTVFEDSEDSLRALQLHWRQEESLRIYFCSKGTKWLLETSEDRDPKLSPPKPK
eukprot:scaffold4688_cov77-Skeletonema_dohrnii-CCMP3373.AAC.2